MKFLITQPQPIPKMPRELKTELRFEILVLQNSNFQKIGLHHPPNIHLPSDLIRDEFLAALHKPFLILRAKPKRDSHRRDPNTHPDPNSDDKILPFTAISFLFRFERADVADKFQNLVHCQADFYILQARVFIQMVVKENYKESQLA
jgi:hypothetical protein